MCCHSQGVAHGPEWGRAGDVAVIDEHVNSDMAVVWGGLRYGMMGWGSSWGALGAVDGRLSLCLGFWGGQLCFIE